MCKREGKPNKPKGKNILKIHYSTTTITRLPVTKNFTCAHCGCKFETTKWYKTKKGYSSDCPCCPYSVWSKRG